jgi:hypothetical protein
MSVEPVEFVIDRNPSQVGIVDLTHEDEHVFVIPNSNVNMNRRCSFCECSGHDIRNCSHSDIEKLHRCAQFMYLTTCRYLRSHPNTEKTHKKWLEKLSVSEYKILAKLNRLDTNSRTKRNEYQEKLHIYYIQYAENELRNDHSTNALHILAIYSRNLLGGITTNEETLREFIHKLNDIIKSCGRHLLDMDRFRYWLGNYYHTYWRPRYFDYYTPQLQIVKHLPKMTHNDSLTKETYEECPICYTEMTSDSMVQLGCSHSFCGDCIIGQIKSSKKATCDCAMCRSTISECRSASANLLQKITSSI